MRNLCIERPVETQFDPANSETPPDETNDQGLGGHAYLDQCFVEYDWVMRTNTSFFILRPQVAYTMTNSDGSILGTGTLKITDDTDSLMTLDTLTSSCVSQLNGEYQRLMNITSSHQEAIAWTTGHVGNTVTWTAQDYAPDLEFTLSAENMNVPMTINADKRGGSFGPLYSKDSVYNDSVWIDTLHIVVGLDGYSETRSVTIERGSYSALQIAQMIANGFNAIDGYRIFDRVENGGLVYLGPRSNDHPDMLVISNDNPYLPLTPGTTRAVQFHLSSQLLHQDARVDNAVRVCQRT